MDPITEQCLAAVAGITRGQHAAPVETVRNAQARTSQAGARNLNVEGAGAGDVTVSTRGVGYMSVDDEPAGSMLNPIARLGLFTRIRAESAWLRYTTFAPVSENTGYLDMMDDRGFRMKPTQSEGPRPNIPLHKPDVSQNQYSCKTLSGAFGFRLKAIRNWQRTGQNVNAIIQRIVANGIGTVLADLGINGDQSLPTDTSLNLQRSIVDGWFTKIRANSSHYRGQDDGFSYHNGIWAGMLQDIDRPYRTDRGLLWGITDTLAARWLQELTATGHNPSNSHPSIINPVGSALLNSVGGDANPLGKPSAIITQMEDDRYSSQEGYSGIAPTSITNNGDGTLTININTLAGSGVDRSETGTDGQRYVTIGRVGTGVEETLAVDYAAPNNTVTTASLLGQTSVSTTAADYYVRYSDTQSMFLGVMRFLTLVIQNGIRVYVQFFPNDEKFEILVHMDLDYLVVDYDAMSLTDDLITPRFSILPS